MTDKNENMRGVVGDFEALKELADMAAEPLHPDLQPWVETSEEGGWEMLRHPLVYMVPFLNAGHANRAYAYKQEAVEAARRDGDWHRFVWLHERPWRFTALETAVASMPEIDWELVTDVWTDSENIWAHADAWAALFRQSDTRPVHTQGAEADRLAGQPDQVTIYRGATAELNEDGLSWTLDEGRARWFAERFRRSDDDERVVITATVPRDRIVAHLDRRGEQEIIALPEDVTIVSYTEITGEQ